MSSDEFTSNDRYHLAPIDLENPKNAHDFQIILTGTDKRVLEFGPATGYVSKILKERGCYITAIERNPTFAEQAKQIVDKIIVGDAETLNLDEVLGNERYDVILMGDFLEHLVEPLNLLKKIRKFLSTNGYIVCSIPNIAHITVRLQLLNGEFKYESTGLIDETHLHFFTLDTILSMLDESGHSINQLHRVKQDFYLLHRTDFNHYVIPEELVESILRDVESKTFQYVFSAIPTMDDSLNSTKEWLKEFPRNVTTDRLKEILHYYKEYLHNVYERRIQEKDSQIYNLQKELLENLKKVKKENRMLDRSTDLNMREIELEIRICYRDELGRDADNVGLQYYLNKIQNKEMSLQEVRNTIRNSEESLLRKQKAT